ncbi:MAG: hypothetical protein ACLPJH_09975 [Myxococcaceae bacterium]
MRRPHHIAAAGFFAACVLLLLSSRAAAQDSTDTPSSTGGVSSTAPDALSGEKPQENGFKIGPGRLHLFLTEGLAYNSAAVVLPNPNGTYTIEGEMVVHTRPGLNLEIDGDNNTFGLNGYLDYLWYTGWITPGDQDASVLTAAADLHGSFNKNGVVGFNIVDSFSRSTNTYTVSVPVGVISLYNTVGVEVPIRPGGKALEFIPHGSYTVELFQQYSGTVPGSESCSAPTSPCNPANLSNYNYQDLLGGLDVKLKFLPETAAVFTSSYEAPIYSDPSANPAAEELKLQVGLLGLVSTKLSVILKAGWAQGWGSGSTSTVIGQAEVTWLATELAHLTVGFLRDVYPVAGNGSYIDDRPYISGKMFLGGRLSLTLTAAYDFFLFAVGNPTGTGAPPTSGRNDTQLTVNAVADYQVLRWFVVGAGLLLTYHTSSDSTNNALNYTQWQPYVQVTFTY